MKLRFLSIFMVALATCHNVHSQYSNVAYKDGTVRFTVITDGAVRLEYSPTGQFTDNASQVAVIRSYPKSDYTVRQHGSTVTVSTPKMVVRYKKGSGKFTSHNISITSAKGQPPFRWTPGVKDTLNLKGTYRTLDGFDGEYCGNFKMPLCPGVLSRSGWTLIDDSKSYLFDNDKEWPWVTERPQTTDSQDMYFMAYGTDYKQALKDFTVFAGKVPLPPRYAFGYWWSRYWSYSDTELRQHLDHFDNWNIPLDVLVIDMDWHYSDGVRGGWTGYTWNKQLFPDPYKFLNYLRDERKLKVTLNIHPADGIRPFDTPFKMMADYMGADTSKTSQIPYEGSNKKFMSGLLDKVLRPMNEQGVSFWWLDWQQFMNDRKLTNLSNTWWINYAFFSYMQRKQSARPMLYHRWGGLGNHRYQIGFSGDSHITWNSLKFQPYFNSTASNVLYGYWSHDIGGHQGNGIDPELYVRWMQFGALSPILRTHSTKQANLNKEPWTFDYKTCDILRQIVFDRYAMAPYIYTMARKTYDDAVSLCRPMYYDYATDQKAYDCKYQYMFGDQMLVCPIGEPMKDRQSTVSVWLPEGNDWYEVSTGTLLNGNQEAKRIFLLDEYPLYVKAGSILPTYTNHVKNLQGNENCLTLTVYPGADNGEFTLYEDAGDSKDYDSQYATTRFSQKRQNNTLTVDIAPRKGLYTGMPTTRKWRIKVLCSQMPLKVQLGQTDIKYTYDAKDLALLIDLLEVQATNAQTLTITYPHNANATDLADGTVGQMRRAANALIDYRKKNCSLNRTDELASMETVAEAINYNPQELNRIVSDFRQSLKQLSKILNDNKINGQDSTTILRAMGM